MGKGDVAFFLTALAHHQPLPPGPQVVLLHPSELGQREEQAIWMGLQISTCGPREMGGEKWNGLGKTGPKHTLS